MFIVELESNDDLVPRFGNTTVWSDDTRVPSEWHNSTICDKHGTPVLKPTTGRIYLPLNRTYHPDVIECIREIRKKRGMADCSIPILYFHYEVLRIRLQDDNFCKMFEKSMLKVGLPIQKKIQEADWVDSLFENPPET